MNSYCGGDLKLDFYMNRADDNDDDDDDDEDPMYAGDRML